MYVDDILVRVKPQVFGHGHKALAQHSDCRVFVSKVALDLQS